VESCRSVGEIIFQLRYHLCDSAFDLLDAIFHSDSEALLLGVIDRILQNTNLCPEDYRAVGALVTLLKDTELDPEARVFVAWILEEMGPAAAVGAMPELVKLLQDTELDPEVRSSVAWILEATGPAAVGATPALVNLLQDTELDPEVRSAVASAFAKIGTEPKLVSQLPAMVGVVPALYNVLQDRDLDPEVRSTVFGILGEMGPVEPVAVAVNRLFDTRLHPVQRKLVAWWLAKIGTEPQFVSQLPAVVAAVPALVNLLQDTDLDPELGRALACALGELAPERTAEEMLKRLGDPHLDQCVRCHLARVFVEMVPRAVPQLANLLRDAVLDREVRKSLACAVGGMGPAVSKGQLVDLLQNSNFDSELRRSLASGFRLVSVPLLLELLADPRLNQDQSLLTEALKRIIDSPLITCMDCKDEKTLAATASLLKHANSEVQNIVRPFIYKMGPQAAMAVRVLETAEPEQEGQGKRGLDVCETIYHGTRTGTDSEIF